MLHVGGRNRGEQVMTNSKPSRLACAKRYGVFSFIQFFTSNFVALNPTIVSWWKGFWCAS